MAGSRVELAPGPRGTAVLRVIAALRRDAARALLDLYRTYGNVVQLFFANRLNTQVSHPDAIRHVLQDHHGDYAKGIVFDQFKPVIGEGLLTSEGELWRRQRKLAQPLFQPARLAGFAPVVVGATEALLNRWRPSLDRGQALDLVQEMNGLTFRIIAETLFSADLGASLPEMAAAFEVANEEGTRRIRSLLRLPLSFPTLRNLRYRGAVGALDRMVCRLIEERVRSGVEQGDLLSALLRASDDVNGGRVSAGQIRDEMLTFLFAGHETTSNALCWTFLLLAQHPVLLADLRAELREVLAERQVTFEDLPRLPFLRSVLQESMRLYPPIYAIQRRARVDDEISGYRIQAGSGVTISAFVTHRHPDFWPEPERFAPERFAGGRAQERHRFAYIPFGAGPRACIGASFSMMEMSLVLATVLRRVDLRQVPGHTVQTESLISLRPRGGLPMTLHSL